MKVENYLISKGFNPSLKGFDYVVEAITLIKSDREYKLKTTKKLYPTIARIFKDNVANVERAIRHSIKSAGINYSNSEFLAIAEIELR